MPPHARDSMRVNLTTQPIWRTISRPVSNCVAPCLIAFTDPALLRLYAFGFPRFLRIESPRRVFRGWPAGPKGRGYSLRERGVRSEERRVGKGGGCRWGA